MKWISIRPKVVGRILKPVARAVCLCSLQMENASQVSVPNPTTVFFRLKNNQYPPSEITTKPSQSLVLLLTLALMSTSALWKDLMVFSADAVKSALAATEKSGTRHQRQAF